MIKAVIFDFDQTLADSTKIHLDSYIIPLSKRGISHTNEKILSTFGTFEEAIFKKLSPKSTQEDIKQMIDERNQILLKESDQAKKITYSDEILQFLKDKVKIILVSGTNSKIVHKILDAFGWRKYFDIIIGGEEIKNSRPHPEILNKALERSKINNKEAIYVGDSIFDVKCAKNANVKVISLGDFKEADFTAKNLLDVKNILENLIAKNKA